MIWVFLDLQQWLGDGGLCFGGGGGECCGVWLLLLWRERERERERERVHDVK